MHHNNNNPRIHNIKEVEGNNLHHNTNNFFSKRAITKVPHNWVWIARKSTILLIRTYSRKEGITPLLLAEQVLWEDRVHHTINTAQNQEELTQLKKLLEHQIHRTT